MGMYTELVLKCQVKGDMPKEVMDVIQYMFADADKPAKLPDHEFLHYRAGILLVTAVAFTITHP